MRSRNLFCVIIFTAFLFSFSCKKQEILTDDCGCFLNMDDATEYAQKNNQDILVLITSDGDDSISSLFIDDIVKSNEFQNEIAKKYSVFHFDFSQKSYEKTVVSETASSEEKKKAELYADLMQTGYQFACLLDCQYTPSIYLLTKECYVISEIEYEEEILEYDTLKELLASYDEKAEKLHKMIKATEKGSNQERVLAIDALYNSTEERHRPLLLELVKNIPNLDSKNETGLYSKYLVLAAESKAIELFTQGDVAGAVQTYISACDDKLIQPEQKQECYYMAAYLLSSNGCDDYALLTSYLELAYSACPDSVNAEGIKNALSYYSEQAAIQTENQTENTSDKTDK